MTSNAKTGHKTMPNKSDKLTHRQLKAMDLMLSGLPLQEIAEQLNLSRQTLSEWKNHHPAFLAKLEQLRTQAEEELDHMLPATTSYMLGRLRKLAHDALPAIALDAIKFYFDKFASKDETPAGASAIGLNPQDSMLLRAVEQQRQREAKEFN